MLVMSALADARGRMAMAARVRCMCSSLGRAGGAVRATVRWEPRRVLRSVATTVDLARRTVMTRPGRRLPRSLAILSPMAQGHSMTVKSIVTNIVCVFIVAPILAALILWGCWVLIPEQPPPPAADSTTSAHAAVIRPAPHTPVSGRTVYMANCAKCHGATGDGIGTEVLDRPARSFLAGGFSFGNTPEAVRRVVQHGIAGTPMPGFAGTLSPAQTRVVVKHVLAMVPPSEDDVEDATMLVTDRPLVLRGMLPPAGPWAEPRPRGLLRGGTDGLTMAYNVDAGRVRGAG